MTTKPKHFPWIPVLALALGTLWTITAELLPAGVLLDISRDVDVAPGRVGFLVTAWGVAIAALSLPLTHLTRRIDRRTLLVASLAGTGAATVLTALAPTYELLVAARIIAAAGHGLFWALVVVTAGSLAPEQHTARAVAVVVAGPTVATVAAIPAATALGEAVGWRTAFALVGALTAATGLILAAALPRMRPPDVVRGQRDRSTWPVIRVATLGALMLVAHFMTFTFIAPMLSTGTSLALLIFGIAGVAGLLGAPPLVARAPVAALPLTGATLAVSLLGVAVSGGSTFIELVAVSAWGVAIGALPVIFQTRLLAIASPAFRPTAGAVMVVALNLGVAAGAGIGGVLHDGFGTGPIPAIAAALALAAAVALTFRTRVPSADAMPEAIRPTESAGTSARR